MTGFVLSDTKTVYTIVRQNNGGQFDKGVASAVRLLQKNIINVGGT